MFHPVGYAPAYLRVSEVIRGRILRRELQEGEALPTETELARQFEVNRSTVREALRKLESNGLLGRRRGGKRLYVTRPTRESVGGGLSQALALHRARVVDVWEALQAVQPGIAAAAAERRSVQALAALEAAARRFAEGTSGRDEAVNEVAAYFDALAEAGANPVFSLLNEPMLRLLRPSLAVIIDRVPQARGRIEAAQSAIVAAVRARDAKTAAEWMARHVRDFRRGYEVAGIPLSTEVGDALGGAAGVS
ncbi:MAG TPA: GntR family transcriptional regulator [Steroidobacteraceae bacterium]|jgi:DNA-binding FadR family transcriptional regulator|nr:GntR family transcriptional regulator [Steroidobacteraceae bacterium]